MPTLAYIEEQSRAVFAEMEKSGLRMDVARLDQMALDLQKAVLGVAINLESITGRKGVNWNSVKEVAPLLEERGHVLPKTKKGRTSISQESLAALPKPDALIRQLMRIKDLAYRFSMVEGVKRRLKGDRVYPIYKFDPALGRVHTGEINPLNWSSTTQLS